MNPVDFLILESAVYGDSAHVAHLVLEGRITEADTYCAQEDVQTRIRTWKANR